SGGFADGFPRALAGGLFGASFVKLPVEEAVGEGGLRLAGQGGGEVDAVDVARDLRADEGGEGGEHVGEVPDGVAGFAGGNRPGPAGDGGDADAAIGEVPLDAAQGAVGVEEGGPAAAFAVGAVV